VQNKIKIKNSINKNKFKKKETKTARSNKLKRKQAIKFLKTYLKTKTQKSLINRKNLNCTPKWKNKTKQKC
jgi:hypothetical protein